MSNMAGTGPKRTLSRQDYDVGWICALPIEGTAAEAVLDEIHEAPPGLQHDINTYTLGSLGDHNVVICRLPATHYGTNNASSIATHLQRSFPSIQIRLMVGIGGGVPGNRQDFRLGDVVVGTLTTQYDFGKEIHDGTFQITSLTVRPPPNLMTAVSKLQSEHEVTPPALASTVAELIAGQKLPPHFANPGRDRDWLFESAYEHDPRMDDCLDCDQSKISPRPSRPDEQPRIHYGTIASGNRVIKRARTRDSIVEKTGALCFEMEAAGLVDHFPCLVIRGICDYCDSHKLKNWQRYAAAVAAAYAREFVLVMASAPAIDIVSSAQKSHFVLPFPRDRNYVERSAVQTWLEEQYAGPSQRIALIGLGGFGKSQVAIEFAYKIHDISPNTNIFWIYGSTKARFTESYRTIADELVLPRRYEVGVDVLALVRSWLQKEDAAPWLIILDNADDLETYFPADQESSGDEEPLASYLPKKGNGKIIVTSRNMNVAERLTGDHEAILRIHAMSSLEALNMLRNKMTKGFEEASAENLIRALDFVPLALNQAASYINRRAPRVSIDTYLRDFQESKKKKRNLLRSDTGDLRRSEGVSNSVVVTWQVTIEQIRRERPSSVILLSLMSFFHPQNIPTYILSDFTVRFIERDSKSNSDSDEDVDEEVDEDEDIEKDLDMLEAYSLIEHLHPAEAWQMHSLIQFCTQAWLLAFNRQDFHHLKDIFCSLAAKHFPDGTFGTWESCRALLPHVQELLQQDTASASVILDWSFLLMNAGFYMYQIGDYRAAEALLRKSAIVCKNTLGEDHLLTLNSLHLLMEMYTYQGRYEEAERIGIEVVEKKERAFGNEARSTLLSLTALAGVYNNQNRLEEEVTIRERVVEAMKRALGEQDPDTLHSVHALAIALQEQNRLEEAEALVAEAVEKRKRVLGEDHPDTLSSLHGLAVALYTQRRLQQAGALMTEAVEKRRRVLGEDHPDTLDSLHSLASILNNERRFQEAEALITEVVERGRRVLGEDHPKRLRSLFILGFVVLNQGRRQEGEALITEAAEKWKRVLGEDHPVILDGLQGLASVLYKQRRFQEAKALIIKVIEGRRRVLREDHPNILESLFLLGLIELQQDRFEEAEVLIRETVEKRKRVLGEDHPDTLKSLYSLGLVAANQDQYQKAGTLLAEAIEGRKKVLGEDHPDTLESLSFAGQVALEQGQLQKAATLMVEAAEGRKKVLGEDHPDTLESLSLAGQVALKQGQLQKAATLMVEAAEGMTRVRGVHHPETLEILDPLAEIALIQDLFSDLSVAEAAEMEEALRRLGQKE